MLPKSLADPNGIWAMAGKLLSCVERSSTELVLNKTVHTDLVLHSAYKLYGVVKVRLLKGKTVQKAHLPSMES